MNPCRAVAVSGCALWLLGGLFAAEAPVLRATPLRVPAAGRAGFTRLEPAESGLNFTNVIPAARQLTNQILLNGSGVTAGDFDGDGWCDVFFGGYDGGARLFKNLGGGKFLDATEAAGAAFPQRDVTGVAAADLDGDGDVDLVASTYGGGTHFLWNDGRGRFTRGGPGRTPPNLGRAGSSLTLGDYDGDGDVDIYQCNYRMRTLRDLPDAKFTVRQVDGQPTVVAFLGKPLTDPEITNWFTFGARETARGANVSYEENGEADVLLRNDGGGRFTELALDGGVFLDEAGRPLARPFYDWGLACLFRDLNGDGQPDLYVCNDYRSPERVYFNDGRGHLRLAPALAFRHTSQLSMGVDAADLNHDGHADILTVDMLSPDHARRLTQRPEMDAMELPPGSATARPQPARNALQLSRGDGTWAEIAAYAGLEASDWSWSPIFLDVDLDGFEDVLVTNGFERDNMNLDSVRELERLKAARPLAPAEQLALRARMPRLLTPNCAFRNLGGLRFTNAAAAWGFDDPGIAQGACLADVDNDGDLDVLVSNFNGPARLFRNESPAPRVAVRLRGRAGNTRGLGANVKFFNGAQPVQSQEIQAGGRFLSSDEPLRVFAAGGATNDFRLEVTWRSGVKSSASNLTANTLYELAEPDSKPGGSRGHEAQTKEDQSLVTSAATSFGIAAPNPIFADVSARLNHTHTEEAFDDFARQPLLPRKLSQPGPGVAWVDFDGDGDDDLLIGASRGGRLGAFRNDGRGGFTRVDAPPFDEAMICDVTGLVAQPRPGAPARLLAAIAHYEEPDALPNPSAVLAFAAGGAEFARLRVPGLIAPGPLALADVDGDGALDLFIGGRVTPGRWPEAPPSALYRGAGAGFARDEENSRALADAGLVSGAVFTDLNGDGRPDLVLACEWGPLKIFLNERGKLSAWNPRVEPPLNPQPSTLNQLTGWWNGVTAGDFDGDGRLDLAASNWGRNTEWEWRAQRPLRVYYGDFSGDGAVATVLSYYEPALGQYVPARKLDELARALPFLRAKFPTFASLAGAGMAEVLGEQFPRAKMLEARWLETTVLLNRGDHFVRAELPVEAQLAPACALCVADADGDGAADLFLGQNFFALPADSPRLDAGRGLWLRGDGRGGFTALGAAASGVEIYGEQRGAAVGDFDADGRPDLVVTQNAGETKLFRNERARPALRARLQGPPGNPAAIGARARWRGRAQAGPAWELHAGAGYLSQDSAVLLLPRGEIPANEEAQVEVHWPGGQTTRHAVPAGTAEITLKP